jgi:hypothetical protein
MKIPPITRDSQATLKFALTLGIAFFLAATSGLRGAPPTPFITVSNGMATLTWTGADDWLQSADELVPNTWINPATFPVANGATNILTLPADRPTQFFRLVNSGGLPPPTRLGLTVQADGSFLLIWDAVSNAVSYNLYMATVSGVNKSNYLTLGGTVTEGITDVFDVLTNLTAGVGYFFVVTAVSGMGVESVESPQASGIYGPHGDVVGSVFTPLSFGTNAMDVPVPGVQVSLYNTTNPAGAIFTATDDDGNFAFPDQPAGNYQVCCSALGYMSNCPAASFAITNDSVLLDPIEIDPLTNSGSGMVYGQISQADGSAVVIQDAFFQINLTPAVLLLDGSGNVLQVASVNSSGQYVFTGVPAPTNLTVQAILENSSVSNIINTATTGEADLVLPNSSPIISAAYAVSTNTGQPVISAPPGTTVKVTVQAADPDTNTMHYLWLPGDGNPHFVSLDSPSVLWTLPQTESLNYMFVRVNDGFGGYATASVSVRSASDAYFSGYVTAYDWTAPTNTFPVPNATITINGETTSSDTNGYFSFITTNLATQYVVSVSAPGYVPQPLTQIFSNEQSGLNFQLVQGAAQCVSFSPAVPIDITQNGMELVISNAAFVYSNDVQYSGSSVCFLLAAFDPCSALLPVGETGIDTNGQAVVPQFQAGGIAQAFDPISGQPLYLQQGVTAFMTVPAGAGCYSNADCSDLPPDGTLWTNNPQNGLWYEVGVNEISTNYQGICAYQAAVPLGGFFGVGAGGNAPAKVVLTINVDDSIALPALLIVRDAFKQGKVLDSKMLFRGKNTSSLMVNLPSGANVSPRIVAHRESPGIYYRDVDAFAGSVDDAEAVAPFEKGNTPKDEILFNDIQNVNANKTVTIGINNVGGVGNKNAAKIGAEDHFLTARFGSGDKANTIKYYQAIGAITDPVKFTGPKDTFGKWLAANGFLNVNQALIPDASAFFFNAGDLGFGREMNLKQQNANNFAFFVTNYKDADAAVKKSGPIATVCMEYSPNIVDGKPVGNPYVKFYVYAPVSEAQANNAYTNSPLVVSANLDGRGEKFVPQLCMVCHGGTEGKLRKVLTGEGANVTGDLGTRFIPFDLESYTYPTIDPTTIRAAFKAMNQLIGTAGTPTPAVAELVKGWYAAPFGKPNFDYDFTPTGWQTAAPDSTLYDSVVKLSCRACHSTRDNKLAFNTTALFQNYIIQNKKINDEVNGSLTMPNAHRTFSVYWGRLNNSKPYQPQLMNAYIKNNTP